MIKVKIEATEWPPEDVDEYDDRAFLSATDGVASAVEIAISAGARRGNIEEAVTAGIENAGGS